MTAINLVVAPDGSRGFMLTDTIFHDAADRAAPGFAVGNVLTVPHCRCVIASSGRPEQVFALVSDLVRSAQSYDELIAATRSTLAARFTGTSPSFSTFALGYSEAATGVRAFSIDGKSGFEPQQASMIIWPRLTPDELAPAKVLTRGHVRITDPTADLLRIMEAQRVALWAADRIPVGGHAILTEIDIRGISQRVVHRWDNRPDAPAARVKPAAPARSKGGWPYRVS